MAVFLELEQRLRRAVGERIAPAVAFGLSVGDGEPRTFVEGRLSHLPGARLAGPETVFDLASLTKPLTTVTWVLRLIEAGRLTLESPIGQLVEVSDPALARTPLWRLLSHTSGLPAHREFFRGLLPRVRSTGDTAGARATVRRLVRQTALERPPGGAETYSDLGFLLLEQIAESVDGPLALRWPDLPLHGPGALHFRPVFAPAAPGTPSVDLCAATEVCPLRGELVVGAVHDENAWICGGVAGHAGLFGRVTDVVAFGRAVVAGWHGEPNPLGIGRALWQTVTHPRWLHPAGTRVLGWDTPSPGSSSAGTRFGPQTIGHLGFTGTSIWIDLRARVVMVLLSNRVCPSRANTAIRSLRPALHDAAWQGLEVGMS
jgi:CubicO group peptidase (beta-lactamase class C family)